MIITKTIGGLGNQMFQYAAGRALALRKDAVLALDVSGFKNYQLHQGFELQRLFSPSIRTASGMEIFSMLGWQSSPLIQRIIAHTPLAPLRHKRLVTEPHYQYWAGINDVSTHCYLSGYWQSEKYFMDASTQIRADFTFRLPIDSENAVMAEELAQVNGVSLHVRRGDYVSNPKANAAHGLCSLEYYQAAIKYIAERVERPKFYIFSDDIEWIKNNLNVDFPHSYVAHNQGVESYNDMRLMSMCRHHIIANSSFSWWGAWLNPSEEKIVIAPKRWFVADTNTSDLYPPGWVSL